MKNRNYSPPVTTLRHANASLLNRYGPWYEYMLTVTFATHRNLQCIPSTEQVRQQLRHLGCTLNSAVWHNRGRFNDKCKILYVPVIEAANTSTRIHAHILLGNVKSRATVEQHMLDYIPRSYCLAPRYDLTEIYDAEGVAWYVTKETVSLNVDAVAWELASIPKPLLPR